MRSALELFTSQGYHASTTPQIARRAGVAEGTIYRHFDSKEHLLNEIYRAALRLLISYVKDSPASASCRDRLQHIALAWRDLAGRDPALIKLVFLTRHGGLLDAKSRDSFRELRQELSNVIASGKSAGEVRTGLVELWTDVWLALVVLALDRIANKEWTTQHIGPQQVFDAAWDAIRAADRGTGGPRADV
ncbi:MAG: TetR family transcriptional regulator [Gemmatimonadales bacterium]|nr:TetR family transcriptional regulator [Gemmatimonadales bacterium]NIN11103.1 TetR family transcriptional regulator [Gemmatimonadales bacterium]NIN49700.1 TetR family transcriptional regulator [Gemmatimonadales bacterium]NIP07164.1 TetR family transcriptional regulator [Gemmatimonadales bacterium]NIQ99556.1 TetR family transcriptional regulator [Gemmatimonadales bacterium]